MASTTALKEVGATASRGPYPAIGGRKGRRATKSRLRTAACLFRDLRTLERYQEGGEVGAGGWGAGWFGVWAPPASKVFHRELAGNSAAYQT
jgi:hypothetical protein